LYSHCHTTMTTGISGIEPLIQDPVTLDHQDARLATGKRQPSQLRQKIRYYAKRQAPTLGPPTSLLERINGNPAAAVRNLDQLAPSLGPLSWDD